MQLTMNDVMNFELLRPARVLAGELYLEDRLVEWVSITEAPVENFVRKNELVLTTGIGCDRSFPAFEKFVHDVVASEACALAVATGRFIFDIPKEILAFAEKEKFPIIEIPWELRFADITHEVMKELAKRQQKELKVSEEMQQELLNIILRGGDLTKVAKYVSRHLKSPILICDKQGLLKGSAWCGRTLLEKWEQLQMDAQVPVLDTILDEDSHHPLYQKIQTISVNDLELIQLPIIQDVNRIQGYLYLIDQTKKGVKLNNFAINLLEHATTACALWFLRENAIVETEMRLRDDFVWSLAKGDITSWERIKERSHLLGYDVELPYVCIVGYPENLRSIYEKDKKNKEMPYKYWIESMVHYIEEEIIFAGESLQKRLMITYQLDEIIIFLETTDSQKKDAVHYFLDLVERRLQKLLPEVVMSWGIGRLHAEEKKFVESYLDAENTLEIGRRQKGPGNRVYYHDTKIERALLSLAKNVEVKELADTVISPLVQYDEQRNMELVRTFLMFTNHHYNVSKTARALALHRQSLLYRLRKIEAITKLSMVNPDDLFLLNLSLRLWLATAASEPARNSLYH